MSGNKKSEIRDEISNYIISKKFHEANDLVNQYEHYFEDDYQISIIKGMISFGMENYEEADQYGDNAIRVCPDQLIPYKIKLMANKNSNIDIFASIVITIFDKFLTDSFKPEKETMILISARIPEIKSFSEELYLQYFQVIKSNLLVSVIQYIPPSKETLKERIDTLDQFSKDVEICAIFVNILINEAKKYDRAFERANQLPKKHPIRLLTRILFGRSPIKIEKNAKILCQEYPNQYPYFHKFLKYYKTRNFPALTRLIAKEPLFASGWRLLAEECDDPAKKCVLLQKANSIFYSKEVEKQLQEICRSTVFIQNDYNHFSVIHADPEDEEALQLSKIFWSDYINQSKDKNKLMPILQQKHSILTAEIQCDAILELYNLIGFDECLHHLELIETTHYRKIYNYLGRLYLLDGNTEKAFENFSKDLKNDSKNPLAIDYVSKFLISEEKYQEAISILSQEKNHEWAFFRTALLYQRLNDHEKASAIFQQLIQMRLKNIGIKDESIRLETILSAYGQSCVVLGRLMAVNSILDHMKSLGYIDHELESYRKLSYDQTISPPNESTNSPLYFCHYLTQLNYNLRRNRFSCRNCDSVYLITKNMLTVQKFELKFESYAAVMKLVGDFYTEAFISTKTIDYFHLANTAYKKRAEIEKSAESFIDLANLFHVNNQNSMALSVLKRVLQKFPDNVFVWANIGVLYALESKFPLARHCFIVASSIGNNLKPTLYAYLAELAAQLEDTALMDNCISKAEDYNPLDISLCLTKLKHNKMRNKADAVIQLASDGCILPNLSNYCICSGRNYEALGSAMLLGNQSDMSLALEALGKYEMALELSDNEEQKDRLQSIINHHYSLDYVNDDKIDLISQLSRTIVYIIGGNIPEAMQILMQIIQSDDFSSLPYNAHHLILKLVIQYHNLNEEMPGIDLINCISNDPLLFYIYWQRIKSPKNALVSFIQQFPQDQFALRVYLLTYLDRSIQKLPRVEFYIENLLSEHQNRDNLKLAIACYLSLSKREKVLEALKRLYLLDPQAILQTKDLFYSLCTGIE